MENQSKEEIRLILWEAGIAFGFVQKVYQTESLCFDVDATYVEKYGRQESAQTG